METTVNQRIKFLIDSKNLSENAFSLKIGVSSTTIYNVIKGASKPGFEVINGIAQNFENIDLNWLITGKGEMHKVTPQVTPNSGVPPANMVAFAEYQKVVDALVKPLGKMDISGAMYFLGYTPFYSNVSNVAQA